MNKKAIKEWLSLNEQTQTNIFKEIGENIGLPGAAVEKDWWVVRTLELIFESSIAPYSVFKGGTSLSKAWNLIDRFSEDIDLALDRKFLSVETPDSEMTSSQVSKLRRKSAKFISEEFFPELEKAFDLAGFTDIKLALKEVKNPDEDPITIELMYPSKADSKDYIQPKILIEVGSRSLIEPFDLRTFTSMIGEQFQGRNFADEPITIPTVNPQRTFLEKIFLLHEEFQLPVEKIKVERKSRHLYDLEKLMDTKYGLAALQNKELYNIIVEHRRKLTPLRGIDYDNHTPDKINPIPPEPIIGRWAKDYAIMQESMLYNSSLPFEKLMDRVRELKARINKL